MKPQRAKLGNNKANGVQRTRGHTQKSRKYKG